MVLKNKLLKLLKASETAELQTESAVDSCNNQSISISLDRHLTSSSR